ncbi:MAG: 2OG-Fe(II) oxygenase, partial [Pararheinheimera sp.]|nr:2OG-Fe(II) oxygenase [Rheinheimera sp.]
VIDGGETEFPKLKIKIKAKQGSLLIFNNTYPNTNDVHVNSLHAGCPVIFGEKWAFNLWFREYTRN